MKFLSCILVASTFGAAPIADALPAAVTTPDSPGYLVVLGRSTDRAKIIAYSTTLPPIYAATGGHYIGLGRPGGGVTCVFGLCEGRSAVIARWADHKSIDLFWWGDAYRKAIRLRDGAGVFTVVGLKGNADSTPFAPPGALLIATAGGNFTATESTSTQSWLDAAATAGARLLAPFTPAALIPLEGDALYNRIALLSFASKEKRDAFATSAATQALIKIAPPLSLIAVDAPAPPSPAAQTTPVK